MVQTQSAGSVDGWFADIANFNIIGTMKDWIEHFQAATKGLPVAHVWRGYGSALFIEFGVLTETGRRKNGSLRQPAGEIGLMIGNDWRIEEARTIVCGSSDEELWEATFARLLGKHVVKIATFGRLPEVLISLSGDTHIASFSTLEGDPAWALFDRRGSAAVTVGCRSGVVCKQPANLLRGGSRYLKARLIEF